MLPEELESSTEAISEELKQHLATLTTIVEEDYKALGRLINSQKKIVELKDFENLQFLIRKVFLLREEKLTRKTERLRYLFGHWYLCKAPLLYLAKRIIEQIPIVVNYYKDSKNLPLSDRNRRVGFIQLTRSYQDFIGCAVNIVDICAEYQNYYQLVHKEVRPKYKTEGMTYFAHIYERELFDGASSLLLRGNGGRFTPTPIIRSALEVLVVRQIFDLEKSNKHKGKVITVRSGFRFGDLLNSMHKVGLELGVSIETAWRLYNWGSVETHKAWRMGHAHMWYALFTTSSIGNGVFVAEDDNELTSLKDAVLNDLQDIPELAGARRTPEGPKSDDIKKSY